MTADWQDRIAKYLDHERPGPGEPACHGWALIYRGGLPAFWRRQVTVADILAALGVDGDRQSDRNRAARCLQFLGWKRIQLRLRASREDRAKQVWVYRPALDIEADKAARQARLDAAAPWSASPKSPALLRRLRELSINPQSTETEA